MNETTVKLPGGLAMDYHNEQRQLRELGQERAANSVNVLGIACKRAQDRVADLEAQLAAANDLGPTAYRAATVMAALASLLGVADAPAAYHPQEWRAVIGAGRAAGEVAKEQALWFCENKFGAVWPVPDTVKEDKRGEWRRDHWGHEAEAVCIGLHHLTVLRCGDRRAQSPLLELTPGKRGGRGKRGRKLEDMPPELRAAGVVGQGVLL